MCYLREHMCKYCGREYACNEKNWICSTINGDEDRNMCPACKQKLEDRLAELDIKEVSEIDLVRLLSEN